MLMLCKSISSSAFLNISTLWKGQKETMISMPWTTKTKIILISFYESERCSNKWVKAEMQQSETMTFTTAKTCENQ